MEPNRAEVEPKRRAHQRIALGVLLGLTFVVVAWMAAPMLVGLALGTVIGFTVQPLHARLTARLGQRRALAAAVTTLLSGLVMTGTVGLLGWLVVREVVDAIPAIERGIGAGSQELLSPRFERWLAMVHIDRGTAVARIQEQLGRLGDVAANAAATVAQTGAGVILTLVVALWSIYYVLLDWPRIGRHAERLLPLDPLHTRALIEEFREVGRRAFVGTVGTAIVQGVLAGVGFAMCGVPQAAVWGAVLSLTSFIPVVGTPLVWVPAAVWLLASGHPIRGLLLIAWSLVIVMASNDYIVRPRLVGKGNAHPLLMLVALIGGISVFGVAGIIVGPILMSLFMATARIYERDREPEVAAACGNSTTVVDSAASRLHRERRRPRSRTRTPSKEGGPRRLKPNRTP